jgi:hypothetical protein
MPIKNYLSLMKKTWLHFKVENLKITKNSRDVFFISCQIKEKILLIESKINPKASFFVSRVAVKHNESLK